MQDPARDADDQDQHPDRRSQPANRGRGERRRRGDRGRGDTQQQRPPRGGQRVVRSHQRRNGDQLRGAGQDQRAPAPWPARRSSHRRHGRRCGRARSGSGVSGSGWRGHRASWGQVQRSRTRRPGFPAHLTTSINLRPLPANSPRPHGIRPEGILQCQPRREAGGHRTAGDDGLALTRGGRGCGGRRPRRGGGSNPIWANRPRMPAQTTKSRAGLWRLLLDDYPPLITRIRFSGSMTLTPGSGPSGLFAGCRSGALRGRPRIWGAAVWLGGRLAARV